MSKVSQQVSQQNQRPSCEPRVARVPNHFSRRGRWTITPLGGTTFQERQRESTSAGASQNHAPPPDPSEFRADAEGGRFLVELCPRQLTEESVRL